MIFNKTPKDQTDIFKLNEVLRLSSNILKVAYIVILILGIYAITLIFEKWKILPFIITILKVLSPFVIGLIIAWLLNPMVTYLHKKNINRTIGTCIVYVILLTFLYLLISAIIPVLTTQINDFVATLPRVVDSLKSFADHFFDKLSGSNNINIDSIKLGMMNSIEQGGKNLTTNLPSLTVNFVTSFLSGVGVLLVGLVIGFFMLFDFDNVSRSLVAILPKNIREDARELLFGVDTSLRNYVQGMLILALLVFVVSTIGYSIIGLRAPILFGLILGITNIIPFVGAYIGGVPAVIVGFVQSPATGILVIIVNIIIQFFEGNFIQPIVMSKAMKLHPVTILLGLLIFEHFFGITGMIIATPLIAIFKVIFTFINEKYQIIDFNKKS
jgi:predicted PurR-regulated permease PerM